MSNMNFYKIISKNGKVIIFLGSANLTGRNIDNLNLESDVKITMPDDVELGFEILDYFEMLWTNKNGNKYSVDSDYFGKSSCFRKIQYRFQEFTGAGTF